MKIIHPVALLLLFVFAPTMAFAFDKPRLMKELDWPVPTRESRPWTRWWWLGSAVDQKNLTRVLTQYHNAGLGGMEICPIYGAKGCEDRFISFLSPQWMEMLAHTVAESKRLGMGVDLTTGTGWPFGGPSVTPEHASTKVVLKHYTLQAGARLEEKLTAGKLQALMAFEANQAIDLTDKVDSEGRLNCTPPAGAYQLYAVFQSGPVQKVKRAAPGGEGYVVDPYSVPALKTYLTRFDEALARYGGEAPRSHFHDSFEYFGAQWTSDFLNEFEARRGYDLRLHLPALMDQGPADEVARVKHDYRETLSDLHQDYIRHWTQWCHSQGSLSRNQAHGAPGNLLDLYAAADIPETEIFREVDERQIPMLKIASSAAHVAGKPLASSESFTWLGEHFQVSLAEIKSAADILFTSGINHIFFHGTPYSPEDVPWPGWLFYASVHFGPHGGLWRDLPEFNAYVTRCQSVLQMGQPDNDVLVYWPVHDLWQKPDGLYQAFTVHSQENWLWRQPVYRAAMMMEKRGYTYDFVSDQLVKNARYEQGKIRLGHGQYSALLIPRCRYMPAATLEKLVSLAKAGVTILVQDSLPEDVPGFSDLAKHRTEFQPVLKSIHLVDAKSALRKARFGPGQILVGADLETMMQSAGVKREPVVDNGIRFIRRTYEAGHHYFLSNAGTQSLEGWVSLGVPAQSVLIMDPCFTQRMGLAALRHDNGNTQIYLQLQPGQSCVLRTFTQQRVNAPHWAYIQQDGQPQTITGTWEVRFVDGGPALPASYETGELASWTTRDDLEAKRFAGTARYRIEFDLPDAGEEWLLDLGKVGASARVILNGRYAGALWSHPFQILAGDYLRPGKNILEVEVTNLAANRIADLDRRKVNWKNFHEINFVNIDYKPFEASTWPLLDSGLLGPVQLIPAKRLKPGK